MSVVIGPEPDETPALSGVMPAAPTPRVGTDHVARDVGAAVLAVGIVAGVMVAAVAGLAVAAAVATRGACMPADRQPGLVHRPPVGRGAAQLDPARDPEPARPCPQPVPPVRGHVGRLGGVRRHRPRARGHREAQAGDVAAARNEAMSYAAYRLLTSRYIAAVGGDVSLSEFADLMDSLCYSLDVTTSEGDTPAAVGNRIADAVLAAAATDGSNEYGGYAATDYAPVNAPMIVADPGTAMADPNRWQPLKIANLVSQNGIPVANGLQEALGPHWGHVTGFALPPGGDAGTPIDPGPPPLLGDPATDAALKAQVLEVIRLNSQLDPGDGATIDISPGAKGANPLGTNDGTGHAINPATGQPYPPVVVAQGDFGRVMAEFWADGPSSETPPGHWNVIANSVADARPGSPVGRHGPSVDRLEWDMKLYLALNGALHDAAIAAWGSRPLPLGTSDLADPVHGRQGPVDRSGSTCPRPEGLPLEPGLSRS